MRFEFEQCRVETQHGACPVVVYASLSGRPGGTTSAECSCPCHWLVFGLPNTYEG